MTKNRVLSDTDIQFFRGVLVIAAKKCKAKALGSKNNMNGGDRDYILNPDSHIVNWKKQEWAEHKRRYLKAIAAIRKGKMDISLATTINQALRLNTESQE